MREQGSRNQNANIERMVRGGGRVSYYSEWPSLEREKREAEWLASYLCVVANVSLELIGEWWDVKHIVVLIRIIGFVTHALRKAKLIRLSLRTQTARVLWKEGWAYTYSAREIQWTPRTYLIEPTNILVSGLRKLVLLSGGLSMCCQLL